MCLTQVVVSMASSNQDTACFLDVQLWGRLYLDILRILHLHYQMTVAIGRYSRSEINQSDAR